MKYEITEEERSHIEKYRDLLPEFQKVADANMQELLQLQTTVMRAALAE
jgi:hypothetical protein